MPHRLLARDDIRKSLQTGVMSNAQLKPQGQRLASSADLPKLVSYATLEAEYGWPKRTIQEWIRKNKFPKPLGLPGKQNYWALQDVLNFLDARRSSLTAKAVSAPDGLTEAELERVAYDLAARLLSREQGTGVRPEDVIVGRLQRLSNEQAQTLTAAKLEELETIMSAIPANAAFLMVAHLFPQLEHAAVLKERGVSIPDDPAAMRAYVLRALAEA
jgi:predicted DNA-binding transcriptional regulator AlpA